MNDSAPAAACSIPCNLCGARNVAELADRERSGEPLRTVICQECGLVWTDPRPSESEVKKFYAHEYRLRQKGIWQPKPKHIHRGGRVAGERVAELRPILKLTDAILDVGSGAGEVVYLLRGLGYDARGIEPNEGYARFARDELKLPIEIGFFKEVELAGRSFDVVTLYHVFEHLEDPLGTLRRLRPLLKRGGRVLIEVPNVEATCLAPGHVWQYHHFYNYNAATLETLGRKAGFTPEKTWHSPDRGNVGVVLEKLEPVAESVSGKIPGNFERISGIILGHTKWKHYATPLPYSRAVRKSARSVKEWLAVKRFHGDAQAMLNGCVDALRRTHHGKQD